MNMFWLCVVHRSEGRLELAYEKIHHGRDEDFNVQLMRALIQLDAQTDEPDETETAGPDPTRLNLGLTLDAETHETGPNINI